MKRLVIVIVLIIMGLLLSSCEKHIRELPIESTVIYIDCNRYDTIPDTNIFDKKPDYVICTNRYTNEEETMSYQDYEKSKDLNEFLKDLYDDIDDYFYILEKTIEDLKEQIFELEKELKKE